MNENPPPDGIPVSAARDMWNLRLRWLSLFDTSSSLKRKTECRILPEEAEVAHA